MKNSACAEFELLAREYLTARPHLRHEWRRVSSWLWGDRSDLLIAPASAGGAEIFATLYDGSDQVTIGAAGDHEDFEDFGRGVTNRELAAEAFAYFRSLLRDHGH